MNAWMTATAAVSAMCLASFGCASGPDQTADDDEEPPVVQAQQQAEPQPDQQDDADGPPPGGYWWGQIQHRADVAQKKLDDQIRDCLEEIGDDSRAREIGLYARRGEMGELYELIEATSYPKSAGEHDCVEQVAADYVEAVDAAFWDDFDAYVATFIHPGEPLDTASCSEDPEDAVCATVGAVVEAEDASEMDAGGECNDELVQEVVGAIRQARDCWSGGRLQDRQIEYEDSPIETRAVMVSDLFVENGEATVAMRYNRPWVDRIATCVGERLEDHQLTTDAGDQQCRSRLPNRAVTLWFGPSFPYLVD